MAAIKAADGDRHVRRTTAAAASVVSTSLLCESFFACCRRWCLLLARSSAQLTSIFSTRAARLCTVLVTSICIATDSKKASAHNAVSSAVKADDRRMHTISVKAIITTTSSAARLVNACRLPRLSLYLPARGEGEGDDRQAQRVAPWVMTQNQSRKHSNQSSRQPPSSPPHFASRTNSKL